MKIKILLVICLIASLGKIESQDFVPSDLHNYFFSPQNLGISSPHVSDFLKYGNLNIDHYNGLLDFDINLDGYKDNDFNIPISLKYISSGFIPSKRPSLTGVNWVLKYGGVISRIVKGSPDETRGYYTGSKPDKYIVDGLLVAIRDHKYKAYSNSDLINFNIETNAGGGLTPYVFGDIKYDMEPDIFNFSFGNYSGSFFIDNQGKAQLLSENGCKIDINNLAIQNYHTTDVPLNSSMSITTPDGNVYEFGGDVSTIEYFIPNNPRLCKIVPRYITSWLLKSITAPNNRKAIFSYKSTLQKAKYNNIVYSYSSGSIIKTSMNRQTASPESSCDSRLIEMEDKIYIPIIDNITIENTMIKFNTNKTPTGFYKTEEEEDKTISLASIVQYSNNEPLKTINFNYDYSGHYFFLSSINKNSLIYNFQYNLDKVLPEPLTLSLNDWGFWGGGYATSIDNPALYSLDIENNRRTDTLVCDAGLLKKVTYPTGGSTEFKYEYNRYTKFLDRNMSTIHLDLVPLDQCVPCGGARLKFISDYDPVSLKSNNRTLYYKESLAGQECGVIGIKPKYRAKERIISSGSGSEGIWVNGEYTISNYTYTRNQVIEDISANSFGNLNSEYFIGYPTVIEKYGDDSYIKYNFSSYLDTPDNDESYIKIWPPHNGSTNLNERERAEKNRLYSVNDLSNFRGKIIKKESYSNQGGLKLTETYKYNLENAMQNYYISIKSSPVGYNAYKTFLTPCQLIQQKSIDELNRELTKDYVYNDKNLIREQIIENSDKFKYSVYFKYPFDFTPNVSDDNSIAIANLVERNIINSPIEVLKTVEKNGDKKISMGILNEYSLFNSLPLKTNINELETTDILPIDNNYVSKYKVKETFHNYDIYGNPTYITTKDNLNIVYLWSFFGQYLIAEIKNATYSDVKSALGYTDTQMQDLSSNSSPDVSGIRNKLDSYFANKTALVTTYTYKPLVGMTSKTDPNGIITRYTYDSFNRLATTTDNNLNLTSAYKYGYLAATFTDAPTACVQGLSSVVVVNATGGSGNYIYNWSLKDAHGSLLASSNNSPSSSFNFTCPQAGAVVLQCVVSDISTGLSASQTHPMKCYTLPTASTYGTSPCYIVQGSGTGNSTVRAEGGSGNFSYKWCLKNSGGSVLPVSQNTTDTQFDFILNAPGVYTTECVVTDNVTKKSVTASNSIECGYPPLSISFSEETSSYTNNVSAQIIATIVGGSGDFTLDWYAYNESGTPYSQKLNTTQNTFDITWKRGSVAIVCAVKDNTTGKSTYLSRSYSIN
ncbi:MAG TPA: RHS repeat domain-containing protein [Paludibacter sp.]|nr:RHS repeat domain-containing protein [Paludibacter sp.]